MPVDNVALTGKSNADEVAVNETLEEDTDGGPLLYQTNQDGILGCTSIGGYPLPLFNFYAYDKSGQRISTLRGFDRTITEEDQLIGDNLGLQLYTFQVTETNSNFRVKQEYDGGSLECEAMTSSAVPKTSDTRRVIVMGQLLLLFINQKLGAAYNAL